MPTSRMEAFSDGVLAIVITIMVLELRIPLGEGWGALRSVAPVFFPYVLSFVHLGIYWNNHHHMLHAAERSTGAVLWANLHLLFWLSLVPVTTAWLGESRFATVPTVVYGLVLLLAAIAYYLLKLAILAAAGPNSKLAAALGDDLKGRISPVIYVAGIAAAYITPWISIALYVVVAAMWLVPDRRIERMALDDG